VYIYLTPPIPQELGEHLHSNGFMAFNVEDAALHEIYSEVMVNDHADTPLFGDDKFFSADFGRPLGLSKRSAHPAWDLGLEAIDGQGDEQDFSFYSQLERDLDHAYLQGHLMNNKEHGIRVEIHPLDSIAFAMDSAGKTLTARLGEPDWPKSFVKWRVAVFANSKLHRINEESCVQKERTTTWFLDLPSDANLPLMEVTLVEQRHELWDGHKKEK